MDTSKTAAGLKDTNGRETDVHPNIARAFTAGKYALINRFNWASLKSMLSPGKVEEKYVLLEAIGSGAWGTVQRSMDIHTEKVVAIKRMKLWNGDDTDPRILIFHEEVGNMKKLCPGPSMKCKISCYLDSYFVGEELWLVMDYIKGVELDQAFNHIQLTKQEVTVIFYHVLEAVEFMHSRGVMHNDIKTDNVMLGSNGKVKLIDLGLSTQIEDCMTDFLTIHLRISAPELLKGEQYDSGTDIWAVGIMLWTVLFRRNVFCNVQDDSEFKELMLAHGKPPIPAGEKLDPDMADLLDQCLAVNRHERPSATLLLRHKVFGCMNGHSADIIRTLVGLVFDVL